MSRRSAVRAGVALLVAVPALAGTGPERVAHPDGYRESFVRYLEVDRPDRNIARLMYVSPDAYESARPGEDLPFGTVLVMEDRRAELDAAGNPVLDEHGRLVPTDEITNVFVMEKQPGFGEAIDPSLRNGDWDYAWYQADGTPRPEASFEGCFSCHLARPGRDYTFTFAKYLLDTR
jgi:hypothetical protein